MTILIQELVYVIPEGFSKFHSFRILKMSRTLASIQLTSTLFLTNLRSGCWLITMNILMIKLDHDYTAIIHMFSVCTSKCRVSIIREAVRKKKSTPSQILQCLLGKLARPDGKLAGVRSLVRSAALELYITTSCHGTPVRPELT